MAEVNVCEVVLKQDDLDILSMLVGCSSDAHLFSRRFPTIENISEVKNFLYCLLVQI